MSIRFHSSVLLTSDVTRLASFYVEVLGQEVEHDFGACVILRCGLSIWAPSEGLTVVTELGYACHPAGNKNLELCFETESLEADAARVKLAGVRLLHDIVEEPWGQFTLRFFDPDGNLVELGESIAAFVGRHYASGLSAEAVAEKTGVAVETVRKIVGAHGDQHRS